MDSRNINLDGRVSWEWLLALLLLLVSLSGLTWWMTRPDPPIELVACTTPETIQMLIDDSGSVTQADPSDQRIAAVKRILRLLAAKPCTPSDEVQVISFTDDMEIAGPAPAAELTQIRRSTGSGTDIAAAVDAAIATADTRPGARQIVIMLTDLEDGSGVPIATTFDRLNGIEVVVVSIGNAKGNGVTNIDLRNSDDIAHKIANIINESRTTS